MINKIECFLIFCIALTAVITEAKEITYTPIPSGFDFPANGNSLLDALKDGNESKLRQHAWFVFAGLTQPTRPNDPGSESLWETWYTGPEVFSTGPTLQGVRSLQRKLEPPRQFSPHGIGAQPQAIGESQMAFTLFNQELKDHTRSKKLNLMATMKALNDSWTPQTPIADRKVPDYRPNAMSLKLIWMSVKKQGMTALPIWDEQPQVLSAPAQNFPTWKRKVAVDPSRDTIPSGETFDFPGFSKSKVVPLKTFYYFAMDAKQAAAFRKKDGKTAEGDYAVLVAMHYTTKEIPNWVWATFWWHDKPDEGVYAKDRLDDTKIKGPWRNYLMDVCYDMDLPRESNGTPNAVFNPWLEAKFLNGVNSNCMTCHQRAVWSEKDINFLPITRGAATSDDPIFHEATKVDFLWSLLFEGNQ